MEKHLYPKEEKMTNEGVVSIVDNDFILNFLNEYDHHPKNSFYANPNLAASFNNFYEAFPLDNSNLHFMGNYLRPPEHLLENNNFQVGHCKMEEQSPNLPMENANQNVEKKASNKKPNNKKKKENKNKPKKSAENYSPVNLMQIKEINENEELFNYRNNIKNTYINKISNLITNNVEENHLLSKKNNKVKSENEDSGDDDSQSHSGHQIKRPLKLNENHRSDELDRLNKKLEKNRESARNSRKRKKIYIELLESRVAELTHQLESAKKSLDFNEQQLTKISSHSKFLNNLIQIKQQIYTKLDKLAIQPTNQVENEMNLLIDSLRLRLGATGKERVSAINSLFKQILQILMPGYVRFLLGVSAENSDGVEEGNDKNLNRKNSSMSENALNPEIGCFNSEFVSEEQQRRLFAELELNDVQKKSFRKFKKKLNMENLKLKTFLENILSLKKNIQKQTMNIDNSVDELRNSFTPLQITKFLLFVEKEKKNMKMNLTKLIINPHDSFDDDSESNSSDFSDVHRESQIEIEPNKPENLKLQANSEANNNSGNEKPNENAPKSRKKVHLNEELVSPL